MKSSMIQSIPTGLASGGTVDGDLVISGDLTVNGGGSLSFDEIIQGTQVIDVTDTEALLVRKNDDGGDVFVVDTTNGNMSLSADTDAIAEIGRVHLGYIGYSDMAVFSHIDMDSPTTFALAQSNAGKTILNSKSGQIIDLKVGNSTKMILDGNSRVSLSNNSGNSTGNTIFGYHASDAIQQGDNNTAFGHEALDNNIDGGDNTAVGYRALAQLNIDSSDTSASYNTAIGTRALDGILTGTHNTAIGSDAMGSADGGETENTAVGYRAMFNNNNGLSNTCIGAGTNLSAVNGQGQIAIGKDVSCIANETATLGFGSNVASLGLDGSDTSWSASSDERLKENIVDSTAGLDVINDLRPVTYNWKKAKDIDKSMPQYKDSDEPVLGKEYGESLHGFVAQEVKVVIDKHDSLKEGFKMWKQSDDGTQTIADGNLIPILVKAVQELSARVKELESK